MNGLVPTNAKPPLVEICVSVFPLVSVPVSAQELPLHGVPFSVIANGGALSTEENPSADAVSVNGPPVSFAASVGNAALPPENATFVPLNAPPLSNEPDVACNETVPPLRATGSAVAGPTVTLLTPLPLGVYAVSVIVLFGKAGAGSCWNVSWQLFATRLVSPPDLLGPPKTTLPLLAFAWVAQVPSVQALAVDVTKKSIVWLEPAAMLRLLRLKVDWVLPELYARYVAGCGM
jgi:hypothetical protein